MSEAMRERAAESWGYLREGERGLVIRDRPPNFDQIVDRFPGAKNPATIFAYGGNCYTLSDPSKIPNWLYAHEFVHLKRQGPDEETCKLWWDKYLTDDKFRYIEELLAHAEEYNFQIGDAKPTRIQRRGLMKFTLKRLTADLYQLPWEFKKVAPADLKRFTGNG